MRDNNNNILYHLPPNHLCKNYVSGIMVDLLTTYIRYVGGWPLDHLKLPLVELSFGGLAS